MCVGVPERDVGLSCELLVVLVLVCGWGGVGGLCSVGLLGSDVVCFGVFGVWGC